MSKYFYTGHWSKNGDVTFAERYFIGPLVKHGAFHLPPIYQHEAGHIGLKFPWDDISSGALHPKMMEHVAAITKRTLRCEFNSSCREVFQLILAYVFETGQPKPMPWPKTRW
jgi:hypothetical protein